MKTHHAHLITGTIKCQSYYPAKTTFQNNCVYECWHVHGCACVYQCQHVRMHISASGYCVYLYLHVYVGTSSSMCVLWSTRQESGVHLGCEAGPSCLVTSSAPQASWPTAPRWPSCPHFHLATGLRGLDSDNFIWLLSGFQELKSGGQGFCGKHLKC